MDERQSEQAREVGLIWAPGEHRAAAEGALVRAQSNPVMSAGESFLAAQVHALLAIEERLGELVRAPAQRTSQ